MSKYPHPPQLMTEEEIYAWTLFFNKARSVESDLDKMKPLPLWQVEGMIATINSLRENGIVGARLNSPSAEDVPE